ncbi:hypothetical protein EZS27_034258, partial [termite gut metagenome]
RTEPTVIKSINEWIADENTKKIKQKKAKEQKRKAKEKYAEKLNLVMEDMQTVFVSVPYGIDHTLNVLENTRQIIKAEKLNWQSAIIAELTAILHDIGAIGAQKKHGSMEGRFQKLESLSIAAGIMEKRGYEQSIIDRVCYIIANHHTPGKINGVDFQILWEADLIENMQVMELVKDKTILKQFIEENFKTESGKEMVLNKYKIQ